MLTSVTAVSSKLYDLWVFTFHIKFLTQTLDGKVEDKRQRYHGFLGHSKFITHLRSLWEWYKKIKNEHDKKLNDWNGLNKHEILPCPSRALLQLNKRKNNHGWSNGHGNKNYHKNIQIPCKLCVIKKNWMG